MSKSICKNTFYFSRNKKPLCNFARVMQKLFTTIAFFCLTMGMFAQEEEAEFSGHVTTSNALSTGFGANEIDLNYNDSLNHVNVNYTIDYRNNGSVKSLRNVGYPSLSLESTYDGTRHFKGKLQTASVSYLRDQGSHLFDATLLGMFYDTNDSEWRTGTISSTSGLHYDGVGTRALKSKYNIGALDLYYRYLLKNKSQLALNVVNAIGNSRSENMMEMSAEDGEENVNDYNISSMMDNDVYSFIAHATFLQPISWGEFRLDARYEYKHLSQTSSIGEDHPSTNAGGVTAALEWNEDKRTHTGWSLGVAIMANNVAPSLGNMAQGRTYFDPWLIATGSEDLENFWQIGANVGILYASPYSDWSIGIDWLPTYSFDHIATAVIKGDEQVRLCPMNMGKRFDNTLRASASIMATDWLEIAPYLEYIYAHYTTPTQTVNFNYVRGGGYLNFLFDEINIRLQADSPIKRRDSNLEMHTGWLFAGTLEYKSSTWVVGVTYQYSSHNDYIFADTQNLYYKDLRDYSSLHTNFRINIAYNFAVGVSNRKHAKKLIRERSFDTGLNNFNSTALPR